MRTQRLRICFASAAALALVCWPVLGWALRPDELLVVANESVRSSVELAKYYLERRSIPAENLLTIRATAEEACSRSEYDERIAEPVRLRLLGQGGKALRALVLMRGVPLRVLPSGPSGEERQRSALLALEERQLSSEQKDGALSPEERERIGRRLAEIRAEMLAAQRSDEEASVDSELSLVKVRHYELKGWIPNPLFLGGVRKTPGINPNDVLRVSRLDAPSDAIVRRVIEDSLHAESKGLRGNAYFDARWREPPEGQLLSGYALWDQSIHRAAGALRKIGMAVFLDDRDALFPAGSRLPTSLYCGWYSLSHYVGAFDWQRGSVGYHIASGECVTLRAGTSQAWCKRMLEEGIAVTLGPVSEPYLEAFPPPHIFLSLLAEGRLTVAEAYILSVPYLSWKMVLVGDPLYRPFAAR